MLMRLPKAILFDFFDTIVSSNTLNIRSGIAALLEFFSRPSGATVDDLTSLYDKLYPDIKARKDSSLLEVPWQSFARQLFELRSLGACEHSVESELVFWRAAQNLSLAPGIIDTIQSAREAGIVLGIVTNSPFSEPTIRWEMEKHHLSDQFDLVISSSDYGIRKPHPSLFKLGQKTLRLQSSEIWFIGNSLEHDVRGAADAGIEAIWYNPSASADDTSAPVRQVIHWDELTNMLRRKGVGLQRNANKGELFCTFL